MDNDFSHSLININAFQISDTAHHYGCFRPAELPDKLRSMSTLLWNALAENVMLWSSSCDGASISEYRKAVIWGFESSSLCHQWLALAWFWKTCSNYCCCLTNESTWHSAQSTDICSLAFSCVVAPSVEAYTHSVGKLTGHWRGWDQSLPWRIATNKALLIWCQTCHVSSRSFQLKSWHIFWQSRNVFACRNLTQLLI